MRTQKRIVVSVISDLVSDQRVHKVCMYLHTNGFLVTLIGRRLRDSAALEERSYQVHRIRCKFKNGIAQYAEFNFKLFIALLSKRADILLANDLDTLVPNFLHAFLRKKKLVYDSHEYFTGTPELQQKPAKRKAWQAVEALLLPKIKSSYTVNYSIADRYNKDYGIKMKVVRNVPLCMQLMTAYSVQMLPADRFILLLQGAGINTDRGAEELIESMQFLPQQFLLVLIGGGDAWELLQRKTTALGLSEKVKFISKVPFAVLKSYTKEAHLGLSLDKPTCLNYKLSLPNKVFDYIQAGVPVLASGIAEVKYIIEKYNVGLCLTDLSPKVIANTVLEIYNNQTLYAEWKKNTALAAKDFCWEQEVRVLDEIFKA